MDLSADRQQLLSQKVPQPFVFTRIDAETVRESKTLAGVERATVFRVGSVDHRVTLTKQLTGFRPAACWYFEMGSEVGQLEFEQEPELEMLSPDFRGVQLHLISPELQLVALNAALEPWFDDALNFLPDRPQIVSISPPASEENGTWRQVGLVLSSKRGSVRSRLKLAPGERTWFTDLIEKLPIIARPLNVDLPVKLRFAIGQTGLALDQYCALETGDVIFLDRTSLSQGDQCEVWIADRLFCRANFSDTVAKVTTMSKLNPAGGSGEASSERSQIGQIALKLVFELGEQEIRLTELQQVRPGYVFELARTVNEPVIIRCNGTPIGTGELVQIQDRVGVRILFLDQAKSVSAPLESESTPARLTNAETSNLKTDAQKLGEENGVPTPSNGG